MTGSPTTDVVLVCPPFLSVVRPSLGLGLLKAGLSAAGIETKVAYLNLAFAERIGVDFHEALAGALGGVDLLGEWIFARAASGGAEPVGEAAYIARLEAVYSADQVRRLLAAREKAAAFVEEAADRIVALAPRIVGFSSSFQQNNAAIAIAAAVRARAAEMVICLGGANCEGPMGEGLIEAFPHFDFVVSGEADLSFPILAKAILAGETPPSLAGVRRRERWEEDAPVPAASALVTKLDALPVPEFDDYFEALERSTFCERILPGLSFESSRGCWWGQKQHCKFCGLNGSAMTFRTKSAERARAEIETLAARWGIDRFLATDNIMALPHIEALFGPLAETSPRYSFFYETKANLKRSQLDCLASAGVTWIQPGIESLDDDILRLMRKGVSALHCVSLLRNARELGMRVVWTFLYGFPGETAEQYGRMASWVSLLEHLDPPQDCTPIRLDRFSPYFEEAAAHGYTEVHPLDAYRAVYALPDAMIARIAYYFRGENDRLPAGDYAAPLIAASSLWNRRFHTPPEPPRLSIRDAGVARIVEDTRACSVQRWRPLEAAEEALLDALREPDAVAHALERTRPDFGDETDAAFARLIEWKFILVDGYRALALPTVPLGREAAVREYASFPGGALRAPSLAEVTAARAAG